MVAMNAPLQQRKPVVPSGVLGMAIFIVAETMMFAGLVSSFLVTKAQVVGGVWPPTGQPRLPAGETAINTAALIASGVLFLLAHRRFKTAAVLAKAPYFAAVALGAFFVAFQGWEWAHMLAQGLTPQSGPHGRFFYLLVGMHAVHVVGALCALVWGWTKLRAGTLAASELTTLAVLWTFVVGLWPVLYVLVYL
jgi:cytochrome c oxidase subunit III